MIYHSGILIVLLFGAINNYQHCTDKQLNVNNSEINRMVVVLIASLSFSAKE